MKITLYNEHQSYLIMKLDCMLQRAENSGACDLNELQSFLVTFRQLNKKAQRRYEHLLESMMELFIEEETTVEENLEKAIAQIKTLKEEEACG